jgi:hypothetical protein
MPSRFALLAVALLLTGLSACSDRPVPTAPAGAGQSPAAASPAQERMRRLARTVARALADSGVRSRLRSELIQSPFAEQKLYFQGLLARSNHRFLQDVARASGTSENQIRDDAANALSLEIYLPLAAHRAAWKGDDRILVATAITDEEAPVAYDTRGREHALDPRVPPSLPVVALVPVETDFSRNRPATATCTPETCTPGGGGSGGGGGGGATPPAPGLYMTYAHATQSFESWLKGNPEFEMHVLGQLGQTDSLKDYQCAGEHAGGPYSYDQNSLDWSGNVVLFSQAQLDNYKAQHPGQSIRIFMVEDDDTACEIRSGGSTLESILAVVDAAYAVFTGGKDSTVGPVRYFQKARAFQKLLQRVVSVINTNDELAGNAVEDAVVGQFYSGANWIIKGENNVTNGWIKLVMR